MNDKDEQHHNSCLQVGVVPEKQVEVETQIPEEVSVVQPPGGSWLEANDLINKKKRASVNKNNNDSDDMMAIEEEPESKKKEKRDRLFLLLFSALTTCFFVGAALGWGPMQLMLESNGSFSGQCSTQDIDNEIICSSQTSMLLKVGLLISAAQAVAPFLGVLVDKIGPKNTAYLQASLAISALAIIIIACYFLVDGLLFLGFGMLALQTWLGSLQIVQLGLYFKGHNISRVIFVLNTLFDAGTITYLAMWGIQQSSLGPTTTAILGGYLVVGVLVYGGASYYWAMAVPECQVKVVDQMIGSRHASHFMLLALDDPTDGSPTSIRKESMIKDHDGELLNNESVEQAPSTEEVPYVKEGGAESKKTAYVPVASRPHGLQLRSTPFLLLCVFYGIQVGICNWNMMTQRDFLAGLGDDQYNNRYLMIFTLLTPVSILGSPLIDWVILHYGWTPALQSINILSVGFLTVKVASDNLNVQIVGFVIYSFYRAFLFGVSFSFLPTLIGGDIMGKAAGIMTGFAGVVVLCLIPLVDVAVKQWDGDFSAADQVTLSLNFITICGVLMLGRFICLEEDAKAGSETQSKEAELDMSHESEEV